MSNRNWNDQRIEVVIGTLLRTGVLIAASVVVLGTVLFLARHGREAVQYGSFSGEPRNLESLSGIMHGTLKLSGRAMIQFGLLLLIATPVARVAFSAVAFAIEGDFLYVWITLIVLAVLLYSLFGPGL